MNICSFQQVRLIQRIARQRLKGKELAVFAAKCGLESNSVDATPSPDKVERLEQLLLHITPPQIPGLSLNTPSTCFPSSSRKPVIGENEKELCATTSALHLAGKLVASQTESIGKWKNKREVLLRAVAPQICHLGEGDILKTAFLVLSDKSIPHILAKNLEAELVKRKHNLSPESLALVGLALFRAQYRFENRRLSLLIADNFISFLCALEPNALLEKPGVINHSITIFSSFVKSLKFNLNPTIQSRISRAMDVIVERKIMLGPVCWPKILSFRIQHNSLCLISLEESIPLLPLFRIKDIQIILAFYVNSEIEVPQDVTEKFERELETRMEIISESPVDCAHLTRAAFHLSFLRDHLSPKLLSTILSHEFVSTLFRGKTVPVRHIYFLDCCASLLKANSGSRLSPDAISRLLKSIDSETHPTEDYHFKAKHDIRNSDVALKLLVFHISRILGVDKAKISTRKILPQYVDYDIVLMKKKNEWVVPTESSSMKAFCPTDVKPRKGESWIVFSVVNSHDKLTKREIKKIETLRELGFTTIPVDKQSLTKFGSRFLRSKILEVQTQFKWPKSIKIKMNE